MQNSLCSLLLLLFLQINVVFSQDWEVVCGSGNDCPQAFVGVINNGLNSIPNLSFSDFTSAPYGATGQASDECSISSNTSTSYLSFLETDLMAGRSYRVIVNSKTKFSGKKMALGYGSSSGVIDHFIGEAISIAQVNPLTPGMEIISAVFTIPNDGDYYITIFPRGDSEGDQVFVDDYRLEQEVLPEVEVSVDVTSLMIEEGEEFLFCVNTSAPISEDIMVEVAVDGAGDPHFSSFTTEEITFTAGGSQQECVTISSAYAGEAGTYSFSIAIQGTSSSATIGNSTTSVSVSTVDLEQVCDWAGPDVTICQGGAGASIGFDFSQGEPSDACWDSESYCVKWVPEEGLDEPGSIMPTANPNQTTTYTVYISDNDGNYYGEDQVTVEVQAMPAPSIAPINPVLCGEENVVLTTLIAGDNAGYSFEWSDPENASGVTLNVSTPGTYSVTVQDLATECSRTVDITVSELDMVVMINSTSNEICDGGELPLSIEVDGTDGPFSYLWSNGQVSEGIVVFEPATYEVTVTDIITGCDASTSIDISPYEIEVEILGAPFSVDNSPEDLDVLEDNQALCTGQSFDLAIEGEYVSIVWEEGSTAGNNLVVFEDNSTALYTATANEESETITVTVTDANGCTATDEVVFNNSELAENSVEDYINDLGFYCIDITILGDAETLQGTGNAGRSMTETPCENMDCGDEASGPVCVRDDAKLSIAIEGDEISDLRVFAQEILQYYHDEFNYASAKGYITYSEDACACVGSDENYLASIKDQFEEDELSFWFFITGESTDNSPGKLCFLVNVPTAEEHNPVSEERKSFTDFAVDYAANDDGHGGFSSEGEQLFFAVTDANLDNNGGIPQGTEGPGTSVLCEGALLESANIIAPSGIPMRLPPNASLSWIYEPYWSTAIKRGCLAGFSDWTGVEETSGRPVYYNSRLDMGYAIDESGFPLEPPLFAGYYKISTKKNSFFEGSVYSYNYNDEIFDANPFVAGWKTSDDEVVISQGTYQGELPPDEINGEVYGLGELIGGNGNTLFELPAPQDNTLDFLLEVSPPLNLGYTLNPGEIEDVDISSIYPLEDGSFGYIFTLTYTNSEGSVSNEYLLVTYNAGEFDIRRFNCFSGSYDDDVSSDELPDATYLELTSMVISLLEDHNTETTEVPEEKELGEPECIYFESSLAGALGLSYERLASSSPMWAEDSEARVKNYAQANTNITQMFLNEVTRVGIDMHEDAQVDIEFILSADQELAESTAADAPPFPTYLNTPGEIFAQGMMSRIDDHEEGLPDAKAFIHFDNNGGVYLCFRLAEDFFTTTNAVQRNPEDGSVTMITDIPEEEAKKLQSMTLQAWKDGLILAANEQLEALSCDEFGVCADTPPDANQAQRPWSVGVRPGIEITGAMIFGEISAIAADIAKDAALSEELVYASYPDNHPMAGQQEIHFATEAPEVAVALVNKVVEANVIAGLYQLGAFGYSMFSDKEAKKAMIKALLDPVKLAKAMFADKSNAYTGDNKEVLLWNAGLDGGAILVFFFTGGVNNLSNLVAKVKRFGKKSDVSARNIKQELPSEGSNTDNAIVDADDHFRRIRDELSDANGFTTGDIDDFWKYLGRYSDDVNPALAANASKFMDHPFLARWWKNFRGDLCPFPFTDGPPNESNFSGNNGSNFTSGGGGCVDFDDFITKLPERPGGGDFYDKLEMTFPDTPEGMEKAGRFIDDAKNSPDDFWPEITDNPDLVEAWESTLTRNVPQEIRTQPEFLRMLDRFPYPTSKQTLIDNATDAEWGQIFSGGLENVPDPDPNAAALVERFGGASGVKFNTDPSGKEFDLISDDYVGEHKNLTSNSNINSGDRRSYRMQMIAAKKLGKDGLWVFEGTQNNSHIDKVLQYADEYQVSTVIELNGVIIHNIIY